MLALNHYMHAMLWRENNQQGENSIFQIPLKRFYLRHPYFMTGAQSYDLQAFSTFQL